MNVLAKSILLLASISLMSACAIKVGARGSSHGNLDSVFGGIDVGKNAQVGNVSSVNGGIDIDSGATVKKVDTVNGSIELGNNVSIVSAETVNGGIDAGVALKVKDSLETVNGGIQVAGESKVGGSIITVNGDIELKDVQVEKNIETVNGDIELTEGTIIVGNIIVEKSNGWFSSFGGDMPIIKIDASSQVIGEIHLYQQVELKISNGAKVGEIKHHFLRE